MRISDRHYKKIELIPGWLDFQNAQLLYELASNPDLIGEGNILEIGAFFGKSAACLGFGLKNNEVLTVIDSFGTIKFDTNTGVESINQNDFYINLSEKKFRNFYAFSHKKPPNVLVGLSADILPKLNEKFKLVHIDGGHSYQDVKIDINNTLKIISEKSMIIFDDYGNEDFPGVKSAVNEAILTKKLIPIIYLGKLYTSTPEFASELIVNIMDNLSGFKTLKNLNENILEPRIEITNRYQEPKKYNYVIRRILTSILTRV
jgi:hypothetical protein